MSVQNQSYDVIVVGAGSAGIPFATRVAQGGCTVLLVEAGPDYPTLAELPEDLRYGGATGTMLPDHYLHDWNYRGRGSAGRDDMPIPRGKVTGGSSAINGQAFLRGTPSDFDRWRDLGNPGWGYADVLPHFKAMERDLDFPSSAEHGATGPLPVRRYPAAELMATQASFRDAARAHGFADCPDHNASTGTGVGPLPLNNPGEIRVSTALAYLPAVRGAAGFDLLANAQVRRILINRGAATGIEVDVGSERRQIRAAEVVLSAGAIGSPQLLMLSGIGPVDQLTSLGIPVVADLPGVGRSLHDHPAAALVWGLRPEAHQPQPSPMVQQLLRYSSSDGMTDNDMWIAPFTMGTNLTLITGVHKAHSEGWLALRSADPYEHPVLDYRLLSEDRDLARLREAVRVSISLVEGEHMQGLCSARLMPAAEELDDDGALNAWLLATVTTSHHVTSTCRMGPDSDSHAVVDSAARVHGVSGLRVVDAAIMPEIVSANTNATTIMIGEKLAADLLAETNA